MKILSLSPLAPLILLSNSIIVCRSFQTYFASGNVTIYLDTLIYMYQIALQELFCNLFSFHLTMYLLYALYVCIFLTQQLICTHLAPQCI